MQTQQFRWQEGAGWSEPDGELNGAAQLLLLFGSSKALEDEAIVKAAHDLHPEATCVGCSTSGEIHGGCVSDDSLVATAVHFDHTAIQCVTAHVDEDDGHQVGNRLAEALPSDDLRHVMVFSDGLHVNGSSLVDGLLEKLPDGVQVTGGMAGDGDRFEHTVVIGPDGVGDRQVAAIGLYGNRIKVGYGSLGGWDSFGPWRSVTKSKGNVLFELDGRPALELYKEYLGEQAEGLPATGLLFPLSVQVPGREGEVVRTILAVDDAHQSLTFAGDVPEGSKARLMKANFDRLVDGAQGAAKTSGDAIQGGGAELGLLISCVGRKLVLKQRVEEELEAVQTTLGPQARLAGFYSYGEICPAAPDADCELHNQTMTITTLREE